MTDEKRAFADALEEAQAAGYAEADPTFDIGGFDAAHKLSLLTSASRSAPPIVVRAIHVEGIETDHDGRHRGGHRARLPHQAARRRRRDARRASRRASRRCWCAKESALAEVSGVTNCVGIDGDFVGNLLLVGPGAGSKPTASAVASDIVDIARGLVMPPFIRPTSALATGQAAPSSARHGQLLRAPVAFSTGPAPWPPSRSA